MPCREMHCSVCYRRRPCITGRVLIIGVALGVAPLVWILLRPTRVLVEVGPATRGPMRVTIDEDGETRAHDRFVIAAPIPGRMLRVDLEDGDTVSENQAEAEIMGGIAAGEQVIPLSFESTSRWRSCSDPIR
jgi:hypothetical protein